MGYYAQGRMLRDICLLSVTNHFAMNPLNFVRRPWSQDLIILNRMESWGATPLAPAGEIMSPEPEDIRFSLIIPAYNEEEGIGQTLDQVIARFGQRADIIVINDGSSDRTAAICAGKAGVRVIEHKQNFGYGAALKTGTLEASTEWVCFFDADGQHDPADVERLLAVAAQGGLDMVVGSRGASAYKNLSRAPGKLVIHCVAQLLVGRQIPDLNSGLRLVNRNVLLRYLHLLPDGFSASTTSTMIMLSRRYAVRYLPIIQRRRVGKSQVRQVRDGLATLMLLLRLITLFNPLRFFIPISVILFATGMIYGSYKLIQSGHGLSTGSLLIIGMSATAFFFGLLCDQISQLRLERFEEHEALRRFER